MKIFFSREVKDMWRKPTGIFSVFKNR